jgi:hypothetical protein
MALITGITGAAAGPEEPTRPQEKLEAESEVRPEPGPETPESETLAPEMPAVEALESPEPEKPELSLAERSYTFVGRAMRFVMQNVIPDAWQSVVQDMAKQLPTTIQLEPAKDLSWENETRHQHVVEDLSDQGFVDAGIFVAASMETKIHLMVNEAYDIRAVVYEPANSEIVLDLVTLFGDGTAVTYVNREDPGIEQSPLHPNVYLGNVSVVDQLETCLNDRPKKARFPETPAAAARLMELEYAFGTRRLRGESVNPIEIADAYLDAIEQAGAAKSDPASQPETPQVPRWTGRADTVLPPIEEAIGLATAEHKKADAVTVGKK